MAIFNLLDNYGQFSTTRCFNGYLRDYLTDFEDENKDIFEDILTIDPNVCVYRNYSLTIQHQLIANKKIGYRDIEKIPEDAIKIPYLLYWSKPVSRCMLISNEDYIITRGMYYCVCEPANALESDKSEIVSVSLKQQRNDIVSIFENLKDETNTAGYIQRRFDMKYFGDMEDSKERCVKIASQMFKNVTQELENLDSKQRGPIIYKVVGNAFFLKKALYVRYMTNKLLLQERHDNNVFEQRKFAKAYIDEISIIPYYQLWH